MSLKDSDSDNYIFYVVEKRPKEDVVIQECNSRKEADKVTSKYNSTGDYSYYVQEHFVLGVCRPNID